LERKNERRSKKAKARCLRVPSERKQHGCP
jgi:hypothetical protein